jgi:hypothetical protein
MSDFHIFRIPHSAFHIRITRNPQLATRIINYFTNLKEKKEKKPKVSPN